MTFEMYSNASITCPQEKKKRWQISEVSNGQRISTIPRCFHGVRIPSQCKAPQLLGLYFRVDRPGFMLLHLISSFDSSSQKLWIFRPNRGNVIKLIASFTSVTIFLLTLYDCYVQG